ncbi:MAG: AAA family ATPase [Leptolyngbyaceae cyanobacterium CRU_2_3]|nr:AAA family ATPase [Leptolyngbyaceae cyanobacterium CRU_2_3]
MHLSTTSLSASIREMQVLVLSFHPLIVMETVEEERVQTLLQDTTRDMNLPLFEWSVAHGLIRSPGSYQAPWVNECVPAGANRPVPIADTSDPLKMLQHIQEMHLKAIFWLKDFARHLEDDAALTRQFREVTQQFSQTHSAIVVSGDSVLLPTEIAHDAVYFSLKLPGREELHQVVSEVVRSLKPKNHLHIDLTDAAMQELVNALIGMTLKQARQTIAYAALEDGKLTAEDVSRILQRKAQMIRKGGVLEYFPVEDKPLKLGGFANLKRWLDRATMGFTPQAQALSLPSPKGILIVGIQGCGKSLAAKTIAHTWKLPLLKFDAGRLYDKYIGESEKNLRQAIALAESMAPAVLWIDEIEKSFTASTGEADGGLSRRLFGFLLTWMQEKSQEVFVIATANDLSQVPPELFRKGRFDEVFFVDLPNEQERGVILQTHLLQHKQNPRQFDFPVLVQAADGFSGAEIEQAVIAALYHALHQKQALDTPLLLQTIKTIIPLSVSRREEVQNLRAIAQERFVSVR